MACLFGLQFPAGVYHWSNPNGGQVEPFTSSGLFNSCSYGLLFSLTLKSIFFLLPICNSVVVVCLIDFLDSALCSPIFIRLLYHVFQLECQVLIISGIC